MKDELRRASEEKEPLLRRGSNKDEKSARGRRESSTSSDKIHLEEPMGPSICPDSVFQTLVYREWGKEWRERERERDRRGRVCVFNYY